RRRGYARWRLQRQLAQRLIRQLGYLGGVVGFPNVIVLATILPHVLVALIVKFQSKERKGRRNYIKAPANTIYPMPVISIRVCCVNSLFELVCNADLLRAGGVSVVF